MGGVECNDGRGFNIVLISSDDHDYGDWYIFKNKTSPFNRRDFNKSDPFAFSHAELLEEIHNVGVIHIYKTDVIQFDKNKLLDLVSDFL